MIAHIFNNLFVWFTVLFSFNFNVLCAFEALKLASYGFRLFVHVGSSCSTDKTFKQY